MVLQVISSKIAGVRRKHAMVKLATALAGAVGIAVLLLSGEMLVDWLAPTHDGLPVMARAAVLAGLLASTIYILLRYGLAPVVFGPDDEDIALWVEHAEPDFCSRLISAVQFARPGAVPAGASAALVRAMIDQTEAVADTKQFTNVVKTDTLMRVAALAALVLVLGFAGMALGGQVSLDLLKRSLLVSGVEVPRKTRVQVLDGDKIVARGDDVTIEAVAHGIEPREGRITVYHASGARQVFSMPRSDTQSDHYLRTIANVQEPFTYVVKLNDGLSEQHKVDAQLRPAVSFIECTQVFPGYTGLGSVRRSPGDLSLLAGSRLGLRITSNKPVRVNSPSALVAEGNYVQLVGSDVKCPLTVDPTDPTKLVARSEGQDSIAVPPKTNGFSVYLVDEHGLKTRDPAIYRIDLVPDKAPNVKVTFPERKEELVTQQATIPISFDVSDDYLIGKAMLRYRMGPVESIEVKAEGGEMVQQPDKAPAATSLPAAQTKIIDLPLDKGQRNWRGTYVWKLAELRPPLNHLIEWWLEVEDTNNLTGPGVAASEKFHARVVTEEEKRKDLFIRLENNWETIHGINQDQEDLSDELRKELNGTGKSNAK